MRHQVRSLVGQPAHDAHGQPGRDDMFRTTAAAVIIALGSVIPASANDASTDAAAASPSVATESTATPDVDWSLPAVHFGPAERSRGALLPVLYVGLGTLNVVDAYST